MKKYRVMWLLNHTTLRDFEIDMLNSVGIEEVFTPKSLSYDDNNLSSSVVYTYDNNLTIPESELEILNDQDWYGSPSQEAWNIANKYFDIVFIGFFPKQIVSAINNFKGQIVLRVFGVCSIKSYTTFFENCLGPFIYKKLRAIRNRFWFGSGYKHLKDIESDFLKERYCFLPVDLGGDLNVESWTGREKKVMLICPRICTSSYYKSLYNELKEDFKGLPYLFGGGQLIEVEDQNVIGYVPQEVHEHNMRELRVMFYHSTEPNHVHYYPFEAIRAGMPLVFMAEGMLDQMGGKNLPGRCKSIKEARRKIELILNDDWALIENIRESQVCLLTPTKPENYIDAWRSSFKTILKNISESPSLPALATEKTKRIGVILPLKYKGGSLRGAKLLAQAIENGAQQEKQNVEVIFCHLDDFYEDDDFADLPPSIKRRSYNWLILNREEANRAMVYAGLEQNLKFENYMVVEDQINQLMDCDLLVIVSDRLLTPLLPVKPYIVMVYDYLQRYENFLTEVNTQQFMNVAHSAEYVWVMTEFTRNNALQFAGLQNHKVIKLPMLVPNFSLQRTVVEKDPDHPYFLWTTNTAIHKNHENAFEALSLYYGKYNGQLECHVTGVNSKNLIKSDFPHLKPLSEIVGQNIQLKRNLKLSGELNESIYQSKLKNCQFLWHAGRIDNGTFSVIEAAYFGVPSLSSDYPAMREINEQFNLNLNWMDPYNPEDMAVQLKKMEVEGNTMKSNLPSHESLSRQSVENLSKAYWEAVKKCL